MVTITAIMSSFANQSPAWIAASFQGTFTNLSVEGVFDQLAVEAAVRPRD